MAPSLDELEGELKRNPRSRRFLDLAREYQRLGRLDEALLTCESGLDGNPSQWQARILLAQLYLAKARMEEARGQVERVLLPLPDNVSANHLAADIYFTLGDGVRALRHYQIVELLEPGRGGVRERIRQLSGPAEPEQPSARFEVPLAEPIPAAAVAPDHPGQAGPSGDDTDQQPVAAAGPTAETRGGEFPLEDLAGVLAGEPDWTADTASFEQSVLEEKDLPDVSLEAPAADGVGGPFRREPANEGTADERVEELDRAAETTDVPGPEDAGEEETDGFARVGHREEGAGGLNTLTLAQLYEKQGYPEKAIEVYQRVLLQDPDNRQVRDKIMALMRRMAGEEPDVAAVGQEDVDKALRMKRVTALHDWLRRVREGSHV